VSQLQLDFEPGLLQKYPRWEDTFVTAVYSCRKGLNGVASDCDQSPSELSKRLAWRKDSKDEPRPLRSCDIVEILKSTGDFTPIYWLIEQFLKDPEIRKQEALARIPGLVQQLEQIMAQANEPSAKLRSAA
jgi:hypothetical protein